MVKPSNDKSWQNKLNSFLFFFFDVLTVKSNLRVKVCPLNAVKNWLLVIIHLWVL